MYTTIIILPIIASFITGFLGRKIGVTGVQIITTFSVFLAIILSYYAYYEVAVCGNIITANLGNWISIGIFQVNWGLNFDSLTVSILIVVLTISTLVHLFSIDYIAHDPHVQRFFSYLSLFTGAILVLVSADNYLLLFVGWEGIGISSYLLIGFWYTRIEAIKSALKALVINRVGDIFYTLGVILLFCSVGNFDIITVNSISYILNEYTVIFAGLILLLAAIGKSAQIGLHTWLPDAINGPTPVSALIHAATLVTAGVYLLIRSSNLLEYSSTVQVAILFIGATTAFFAATTGIVQNDIKTVIAYSTCSQLGYIFIALGISQYNVALFHLVNHAFFKAILFLSAGAIIHATIDEQDIRRIGGILGFLPFTYSAILTASISLIAIPFLTGFYSKDFILELAIGQYTISSYYAYILGTITAGITAFYSLRLLSIAFISTANGPKIIYNNIHESGTLVIIPLVVLFVFAVFFGYISSDIYIGLGSDILDSAILIHPNRITQIEAEFSLSTIVKLLPLFVTIAGSILGIWLYQYQYNTFSGLFSSSNIRSVYTYFSNKWHFDTLINSYISYPVLHLGYNISTILDKGIIEIIGPYGLSTSITQTSIGLSNIDTGNITDYALYLGVAIVIISSTVLSLSTSNILDTNTLLAVSTLIITYNVRR